MFLRRRRLRQKQDDDWLLPNFRRCMREVRPPQSARGLAQSKTWRISGAALGKSGRETDKFGYLT